MFLNLHGVNMGTSMQNFDTLSQVPVTVQATVAMEQGDVAHVERRNWYAYTSVNNEAPMPANSSENAASEKSIYFTGFLIPNVLIWWAPSF